MSKDSSCRTAASAAASPARGSLVPPWSRDSLRASARPPPRLCGRTAASTPPLLWGSLRGCTTASLPPRIRGRATASAAPWPRDNHRLRAPRLRLRRWRSRREERLARLRRGERPGRQFRWWEERPCQQGGEGGAARQAGRGREERPCQQGRGGKSAWSGQACSAEEKGAALPARQRVEERLSRQGRGGKSGPTGRAEENGAAGRQGGEWGEDQPDRQGGERRSCLVGRAEEGVSAPLPPASPACKSPQSDPVQGSDLTRQISLPSEVYPVRAGPPPPLNLPGLTPDAAASL